MLIIEKATGLEFWAFQYLGRHTKQKDILDFIEKTELQDIDCEFNYCTLLKKFDRGGYDCSNFIFTIPITRAYRDQYIIWRGGIAFEVRDNIEGFKEVNNARK